MSSGAISVRSGRLPEMKTIEPYSPSPRATARAKPVRSAGRMAGKMTFAKVCRRLAPSTAARSEEHTSELQSHLNLVCRLLLEKKNKLLHPLRILDEFT